jgi:prophage maintenance system killer protein
MTRHRTATLTELAGQAGIDPEELLIRLWEAGVDDVEDPDTRLRSSQVTAIRELVGLPSSSAIRRVEYWQSALGMSLEEIGDLLEQSGLRLRPGASTLPKGAVKRLKQVALGKALLETPPVEPIVTSAPFAPAPPELEWVPIGNVPATDYLDAAQVEAIHWKLAEDFAGDIDPIKPAGVRDRDLLESAVTRQHTAIGEESKYPTAVMSASALLHSVVMNHPFFNGNKRTGLVCLITALDMNGIMLVCDEKSLFQTVVRLANHNLVPRDWPDLSDREVLVISEWVERSSRQVELGERPVQWRKLKQILARFEVEHAMAGRGNRLNLTRTIRERGRLGRSRPRILRAQVKYTDDGRDAQKHTLHQIRRELELDNEHGVDSASFYGDAGRSVGDFIIRYRNTLNRLAKL